MLKDEEPPPGQLLLAIRQFISREWSGCHEKIEEFGINCLKRVSDVCLWVDVSAFIAASESVRVALAENG